MSHQNIIDLAALLQPIILSILTILAVLAKKSLAASGASVGTQKAMASIIDASRICAGNVFQTVVRDLKDPSKPGTWDQKAKEAAKAAALTDVHTLTAGAKKALLSHGMTSAAVDSLIDKAIESAVADLKAQHPELDAMPKLEDMPTPSMPPEPPKPEAPKPIEPEPAKA